MNQKQKYKVFINDKSLEFGDSPGCFSIPGTMQAERIPSFIEGITGGPSCFTCNAEKHISFEKFINSFRIIKAAGGLVRRLFDKEERFLVIYRLGKWDLPKGKLDSGESVEECAMREIEEECGIGKLSIKGSLPDTWHMYQIRNSWVLKQTFWFEMDSADTRELVPALDENIERAEWFTRAEIMLLLPDSYTSIAHLLRTAFSGR